MLPQKQQGLNESINPVQATAREGSRSMSGALAAPRLTFLVDS
jgi:hypothetical protein